jgi:tetratricopeptide (TPR) repeat protein
MCENEEEMMSDEETTGGSAEPGQLLRELMGVALARRGTAARWERFRSLELAELLLEESELMQDTSPAQSQELAWTAQLVADQPYPVTRLARVDRILARSHCLQGDACRRLGDRHGAEAQLQAAVHYLTGPPLSLERGFYCDTLASLRDEQGRLDEASALLWRAVAVYRAERRFEEQGACLGRVAFLSFHEGDLEAAGRLFSQARGLLSFERSPGLAARCSLGYAVCLAALGEEEQALFLRRESQALTQDVTDGRDLLEIEWLEGRLAAALGEDERAVRHLSPVRRRLVQLGRLRDAALCSLDLARVYVTIDQETRIGELIAELQAAFPVSLDQARMLMALDDFRRAVKDDRDVEAASREALDLIRRPAAVMRKL